MPALLLACAGSSRSGPSYSKEKRAIVVRSQRVEVDPEPGRRRVFGSLTLLAAFQLSSSHPRFGGLSSLTLGPEGDTLYGVSDRGAWLSVKLHLDHDGRLTRLSNWRLEPIRGPLGHPVEPPHHDAESVVRLPDGSWLVGFEREHRVWRFRPDLGARPKLLPLPPRVRDAPNNGGLEGMTVLADGRLLLLCERFKRRDGAHWGWVGLPGAWSAISLPVDDRFVPTDLTTIPGSGDVLVLERSFSVLTGLRARIRLIPAGTIHAGEALTTREIGRLEPPLVVDNFEGLAAQRHKTTGKVVLYVVSDDNFSHLQQTLLFQFQLKSN
jgi:hypothetical protein